MEHKLRLLSQLGPCRVEGCTCGVVHLTIGAMSIRLSAEHATQLTQALTAAAPQFQQEEQATVAASQIPGRGSDEGDKGPQIH